MLCHQEDLGLCMKVVHIGAANASSGSSERMVLYYLQLVEIGAGYLW